MEKINIDFVEKNGLLAYKYLRGSWSHGIGILGKSDFDYGGVWICPPEMLLGLRSNYAEQVADEKNDVVYYEFGRWIELLLKSNPTALESLYVPKDCIVGDVHPAIQFILDNKDIFLTKEAFNPLLGYSFAQIKKSYGYNKKCIIPNNFERKDVLDFCYTFYNQGSQPIKDFLKEHHLDQRYCGLVNIPNMKDTYGVYYDFAAYFKFENIELNKQWEYYPYIDILYGSEGWDKIQQRINDKYFFKYGGIADPDNWSKSNTVRLSSIPKGEIPICQMTFNKDAYVCHCKKYKEWAEWKKNRNETRYLDNQGFNYDAKNMCETIRLIHTGIELARDGVFNVKRTWDREFLLDIKSHKYSYDELISYSEEKKKEFEDLVFTSKLPDKIDIDAVNKLLIKTRKIIYKI